MTTTAASALTPHLPENIAQLVEILGESSDIIIRELGIGRSGELPIAIVFTDGLADHTSIHELLESLMLFTGDFRNSDGSIITDIPGALERYIISLGGVRKTELMEDLYDAILSGDAAIMLDNCRLGLIVSTRGWESRGITESNVEAVVRGPRESFTETLRTNTSLIRRRIKHPSLRVEALRVGRISKTDVSFMYIKGIADDKVVDEVRNRIQRIDIDAIMDTGQIEELIQDEMFSPFPTIYNSERPDTIAAGMLEGRVAILVDGSPFVLLVPVIFTQFLQSAEDYYQRSDFGVIRMLRYVAMLISLLTPSVYIAVTTYHQEMLPTTLLLSLATQREGVPFPAFIEALLMETAFEILREAGIRMPRMIGSAISIVGALVLGEAAVQAGLVSAAMVIVVSITAIASFVMPAYSMSIPVRLLRYLLMFIAASFGIYGIFLGCMCILFHLCSLRSFGVPYMSPFGPFHASDQKDAIFRLPLWAMQRRPSLIGKESNQIRIKIVSPGSQAISSNKKKGRVFLVRKKIRITLLIILLLTITTGCWNRKELNQLSFVMALGIDKHGNQIELSAQVANVGEIGMGTSSEHGTSVTNFHVVCPTLYEGLRKMTSLAPRELYLSHLRMLVISEELAREGLRDVLDFFMRNEQMRPDYYVAIAKDVQAKEVLSTLTPTEKIPANKLYSSLRTSQNLWAPTIAVHVDQFVANLVALGKEPVLTGLKSNGEVAVLHKENKLKMLDAPVGLEFTQIGVFRGDRLVGWLNELESKGFNYISGNVKSTVGYVLLPDGGEAAIHILRTKSKVTAAMKEGGPVFTVNLQVEGDIGEVKGSIDLTKSESIYMLEQVMEKKLKEGLQVAVSKAQKLESDIFGFGEILHRSDPSSWKKVKSDWPSYFVQSEVIVHVDARLRRTGKVSSSFIEELTKKIKE